MSTCYSCFKNYDGEFDICPHCGSVIRNEPVEPIQLRPGTVLLDRYIIGLAVGAGGFGIVYRAWDRKLETVVAVKEFFLQSIMSRAEGETEVIINRKSVRKYTYLKSRFLSEARTLARFGSHKNIVNVFEFFEENKTAYIVMEYLDGEPLNRVLHEKGRLDPEFALFVTNEVGNALKSLHKSGIVHRDISPENIFVCSKDELKIKLLDFGAAKLADDTDKVIDLIMKPGYSPVEQYNKNAPIGPWTDVYALGATLYAMITGIKPDESKNREIEDTLIPPHDLEQSIPENMSNAIMKALAIYPHMRYKNVDDFLKALNGDKKVLALKEEKRRRTVYRTAGISAITLLLIIFGVIVFFYYDSKRDIRDLPASEISVWFPVDSDQKKEQAVKSVLDDFNEKYPEITIEYRAIASEDYEAELERALADGTLPTLFESSGVPEPVLNAAQDVTRVLKSEQAGSCLFLDQYDRYYSERKQIPLAIEVPMAYIINSGNVSVEYNETTFDYVSDLGSDVLIALDERYTELIGKNFNIDATADTSSFMNNEENTCAVLISSSRALNDIRSSLTKYKKTYSFYSGTVIYCRFCYEWSIGDGSRDQHRIAERLLSWMLGNNYQNMLMISRDSDGSIPINKECFETKAEQKKYSALKDIMDRFVFEK